MWVKALDMIMDRLRVCGVDFSRVAAVSGSAQQHGTVYWAKGARKTLGNLDPDKFLHEQLVSVFSVTPAPIWMDSSTSLECRQLEEAVGGPQRMAEITGSRAYERFSGPQIAKIYKKRPEAYEATERISLVSSFAASLFLGDYAPIDWADGSGMNLLDLRSKDWRDELLEACAPGLRDKLGPSVSSSSDCGPIAKYFVERFGFDDGCRVVAFTGDNPASMAGLRLSREGDLACSLGTSDVLFLWLNEPRVVGEGHVFCNPVEDDAYMAVLCSKNGSLTRERIRNSAAGGDWKIFNELLDNTPRGNFGNCALYLDQREIAPAAVGDHRFNKANDRVGRYSSKEVEVRALVEGQFIGRRAYAEDFGFELGRRTRIVATGGASANQAILQVLSDVFNAPVYVAETPNSAMMGGAYRAKHALRKHELSFEDVLESLPEPRLVCRPYDDANSIYAPMVERYRSLVERILAEQA